MVRWFLTRLPKLLTQWGIIGFSTNNDGTTGYLPAEKWSRTSLSLHI